MWIVIMAMIAASGFRPAICPSVTQSATAIKNAPRR
jgi:hypothetical protein